MQYTYVYNHQVQLISLISLLSFPKSCWGSCPSINTSQANFTLLGGGKGCLVNMNYGLVFWFVLTFLYLMLETNNSIWGEAVKRNARSSLLDNWKCSRSMLSCIYVIEPIANHTIPHVVQCS